MTPQTKLMFCDTCDRGQYSHATQDFLCETYCPTGWHYDCLTPPLDGAPPGAWICPTCILSGIVPIASSSKFEELYTAPSEERAMSYSEEHHPLPEPIPPTANRGKGKGKAKARPPTTHQTPARKRARIHPPTPSVVKTSASPRKEERVTFRLRLPGKKGKEKATADDDQEKSPFESILSAEASDISKTVIMGDDKARFEKSRVTSEVC